MEERWSESEYRNESVGEHQYPCILAEPWKKRWEILRAELAT